MGGGEKRQTTGRTGPNSGAQFPQVQELPCSFLEGSSIGISTLRMEGFLEPPGMEVVSAQLKERHCPALPASATLSGVRFRRGNYRLRHTGKRQLDHTHAQPPRHKEAATGKGAGQKAGWQSPPLWATRNQKEGKVPRTHFKAWVKKSTAPEPNTAQYGTKYGC